MAFMMRVFLTALFLSFAVFYATYVGGMFLAQRQIIFVPKTEAPARPQDMRAVSYRTDDGLTLTSWSLPVPGRPVIAFLHGNGGTIAGVVSKARRFARAGYGALLVEYRGYGGNPGEPTEDGLYADARAAMAFLKEKGVAASNVVLYGMSLGGGVAARIAAEQGARGDPVGALVIEAGYSSLTDIAAHRHPYIPARWLLLDRFDAQARIADANAPVLVLHGEKDTVLPVQFARKLFESAREPKTAHWFPDAGHANLVAHGAEDKVFVFLARHLASR